MKNMTRGALFLLVACATSVSYGGQPDRGVAGVDVVVKQNPSKRGVTDARGAFAFAGLAPGSYTLTFRSRKAQDTKTTTPDKVTVASSYSIKIDGTKRSVNQSGLTSDRLIAGVDVPVQLGAGATIRGQVSAGATKKMVWIPKEPGSNIPGRWVEAGSGPAAAQGTVHSARDMHDMFKGTPNQLDEKDPRNEGITRTR